MPQQQTDWLGQYLVKEAATAPPPAAASSFSPAVSAGTDWLSQFAVKPTPAQVQVPSSFATVNGLSLDDDEPAPRTAMTTAYDYFSEALSSLNPKTIVRGLGDMLTLMNPASNPGKASMISGAMGQAQLSLAKRAKAAFDEGDVTTGMRYGIPALIPLLGPRLGEAQEYLEAGDTAKGLGALTDVGVQLLGPKLLSKAAGATLKVPALAKNPNAIDAAAVAAAEKAGVPVDAATATNSPYVRSVQRVAEHTSLLGAREGQRMGAAQAEGLKRWGTQLADRTRPGGPVSLEEAGQGVVDSINRRISSLHQEANTAYDALRKIEVDPANAVTIPEMVAMPTSSGKPLMLPTGKSTTVQMPVDVAPVKAALQPIYDKLAASMPLAQRQASPGLNALEQILNGPDQVPMSTADANLSAIKRIARSAESPDLRTVSQGVAKKAIDALDSAVSLAAQKAGPAATAALQKGRTAVKAKYAAADALKALTSGTQQEPVRIAGKLTRPADTTIRHLERVEKLAPQEMPRLARAYLDSMLETATAKGGFQGAAGLSAQWSKLGARSKQLLFKDAAHVRELDQFFNIAQQMSRNPNTSGTAYVLGALAHGPSLLLRDPVTFAVQEITGQQIARLLHSKSGVRALTRGMSVPMGNTPAAATAYSSLLGRIGAASEMRGPTFLPSHVPVGAQSDQQPQRP